MLNSDHSPVLCQARSLSLSLSLSLSVSLSLSLFLYLSLSLPPALISLTLCLSDVWLLYLVPVTAERGKSSSARGGDRCESA